MVTKMSVESKFQFCNILFCSELEFVGNWNIEYQIEKNKTVFTSTQTIYISIHIQDNEIVNLRLWLKKCTVFVNDQ